MNTIEKIEKYINDTKIKPTKAAANAEDILLLAASMDPFRAVSMAFMYGRAMGWRAAKREVR